MVNDTYHLAQVSKVLRGMPSVKDGVEARKHPKEFAVAEPMLMRLDWEADVERVRKAILE